MGYRKSNRAYTEVAERVIYILHGQSTPYYYIGHCRRDLIKAVYNAHMRGEYHKTSEFVFELKEKKQHPCLHILEEVTDTKVMAYRHVIAWTRIFDDNAYETLDEGRVLEYMGDLVGRALAVYEANKNADVSNILKCDTCIGKTIKRISCPI